MWFKEAWYYARLFFLKFREKMMYAANLILFLVSVASLFLIILNIGYDLNHTVQKNSIVIAISFLCVFFIGATLRFAIHIKEACKEKLFIVDLIAYVILLVELYAFVFFPEKTRDQTSILRFSHSPYLIFSLLGILSLIQISKSIFKTLSSKLNWALLFISSFAFLILLGTILLSMPHAYRGDLSFTDALFTATSSVCVTGLCTIDIPSTFTITGQLIILFLIQVGGIGVMTFTSFFALSFMGQSSFSGSILLRDFLNEDNLGNIFKVLVSILVVTLLIEALGAYWILQSIQDSPEYNLKFKIFIAIFHSVSAFCNAGISIVPDNLANPLFVHNYSAQYSVALLIIFGGLGFPIVLNYMKLLRHFVVNIFHIIIGKQKHYVHQTQIINVHARITMVTTGILLVAGTIFFFSAEYNHAFKHLDFSGKLAGAFLSAVTPRTAGFSIIDMDHYSLSTLFFTLILMMIGAGSMSTGGGMKASTVAIGFLATINAARGKQQLEIEGREIEGNSVQKAFGVICLYLTWMCIAVGLLTFTEQGIPVFTLMFEAVSALSTVGLSLNFSPHLSDAGKYIIISCMFIGRIGALTFLSGLLKRYEEKQYQYPKTGVIIG